MLEYPLLHLLTNCYHHILLPLMMREKHFNQPIAPLIPTAWIIFPQQEYDVVGMIFSIT
jgi:hypothetical protein